MASGASSLTGSFGYGKSHGSSLTTTNSSGSSEQNLSGKSTTTTLDEDSKRILDTFTNFAMQNVLGGNTEYTKQKAIADTQNIIASIFGQYRETLPQIYNAGLQTGTYGSTQQQGLANNAYATAVAKSGEAVAQNILNYANIANANQQTSLGALASALDLQTKAKITTDEAQNLLASFQQTSTSTTRSSGGGWNLGLATGVSGSGGFGGMGK